MQIRASSVKLRESLALLATSTELKGQPILSFVKIESQGEESVRLSATDMDTAITIDLDVEVVEEGSMCVQLRKLLDILKPVTAVVTLQKENNNWTKVTWDKRKFRLPGFDDTMFPVLPTCEDFSLEIEQTVLTSLIKSTIFAITNEESRFSLAGVKFEVSDGTIVMVATDGSRVSYREEEGEGKLDALLPKKCLSQVVKLPKGIVEIGEGTNHLFFKSGNTFLSARKLSGEFPNYKQITDLSLNKEAILDGKEFKSAVESALQISDDITHAIKLSLTENELTIRSESPTNGEFEGSIEIEYEGDDIVIGLNSTYLKDFLNIVGDEKVYMNFESTTLPIKLSSDNRNFKVFIMPLRM